MTEREALKLALEALEWINRVNAMEYEYQQKARESLNAIYEALAEQEPVVWKHDCAALLTNNVELWIDQCPHCGKPRTSPPAQRKPLTDEEIKQIANNSYSPYQSAVISFARAIEAAHGIKGEA